MNSSALVRNAQPGPTVFSYDPNDHIEWQGANDPMGGDLQSVPGKYFDNVQFQRALATGILVLEEAPEEIARAAELHRREWENRQHRQRTANLEALDQQPQNDMLMLSCIGPTGKGLDGQLCGVQVPVRQRARNEQPPLCGPHSTLASRYIAEETDKIVDGKPVIRWVQAQMGNRTSQH